MSFHADIPHFYCKLRAEYLYDGKSHHGEFEDVLVFGVDSVAGTAVGFEAMTSFGGMFARLPVSALVHRTDAPNLALDYLELWNNFSYSVEAHEWAALKGLRCAVLAKDKVWLPGEYMFTLSWWGSNYAEHPGEGGFKRGQVIRLDNGCFAIQPNNRLRWFEPSFITKPFPTAPGFKTNSQIWNCERGDKWQTADSDDYFYGINQAK